MAELPYGLGAVLFKLKQLWQTLANKILLKQALAPKSAALPSQAKRRNKYPANRKIAGFFSLSPNRILKPPAK